MKTIQIVDPHIHLFDLAQGDYQWLLANNPPFWPDKHKISKSFSEQDISLRTTLTLTGFIHIEAGFDNERPWREVAWLEQNCKLPFRAVAAVDLTLNEVGFKLLVEKLVQYQSVVGVRHILDEDALDLLSNAQVIENFMCLNDKGLNFEVQMPFDDTSSVKALLNIIDKNKNISFIINHAGFPPVNVQSSQGLEWQRNLAQVAQYKNVAIKCSGWEMIDRKYNLDWLKEVVELCIAVFSTTRVMLASNFPLVLFSQQYQAYWQLLNEQLDVEYRQALFKDNAQHWYQLPGI